jgi:hypothetical protein
LDFGKGGGGVEGGGGLDEDLDRISVVVDDVVVVVDLDKSVEDFAARMADKTCSTCSSVKCALCDRLGNRSAASEEIFFNSSAF